MALNNLMDEEYKMFRPTIFMFATLLKFQLVLGMPNDGAHMWRVGLVWPWGLFPPP